MSTAYMIEITLQGIIGAPAEQLIPAPANSGMLAADVVLSAVVTSGTFGVEATAVTGAGPLYSQGMNIPTGLLKVITVTAEPTGATVTPAPGVYFQIDASLIPSVPVLFNQTQPPAPGPATMLVLLQHP
jgi:hypothetical protein